MLVIALTGGIGSGKTTVSELFKSRNIPVIDTDIIARQVVEKHQPAYKQLIKTFGKDILDHDNNINREKLRELVFVSSDKRILLENILHPIIWNEVISQLTIIRSSSVIPDYCIVVVPLLFESDSQQIKFDRTLVIDSPEQLQINRTVQRDQCDEVLVRNIMDNQVSRQIRLKLADDIITNTGSLDLLKNEFEKIHRRYLKLSE